MSFDSESDPEDLEEVGVTPSNNPAGPSVVNYSSDGSDSSHDSDDDDNDERQVQSGSDIDNRRGQSGSSDDSED